MPRNSIYREAQKALRFEGLEEIERRLSAVIDRTTGAAAKEVYLKAGLKLRDKARELAPIKTGALRKSIFAARGDENKQNVLVGVNYKIAPHAHLIEYGTVRAPAHPFLRPAVSATKDEMRAIIRDGLEKIIEDAARGRH